MFSSKCGKNSYIESLLYCIRPKFSIPIIAEALSNNSDIREACVKCNGALRKLLTTGRNGCIIIVTKRYKKEGK